LSDTREVASTRAASDQGHQRFGTRLPLARWRSSSRIAKEPCWPAVARNWIASNLGGLDLKAVAKAMHDLMVAGGVPDQVNETRPEWSIWPFHYDFRFTLGGKQLYIETILQDDDPDDPTIQIVSIHDA
jgi:hypothetical protein